MQPLGRWYESDTLLLSFSLKLFRFSEKISFSLNFFGQHSKVASAAAGSGA